MKLIQTDYEHDYHSTFWMREVPGSQRIAQRLKLLLKYKQAGRLLEIGVGQAGFLKLAQRHFQAEGIDASRQAVDALAGQFKGRVRQANVETKTLPARAYDAIAIFNVIEHLPRPGEVLPRLFNTLAPGGVMVGSTPNNSGLVGRWATQVSNYFDRTHVSTLPPDEWRVLFLQAGFATVTLFGELCIGRNLSFYLRAPHWPHLCANLMFVCKKEVTAE